MKSWVLPFMSIVVICHNGEETIDRTLQSLLSQRYPKKKYEIIVVDDASTDGTGKIVLSHKTVRYIRLPENRGISGARNAGIAAVKGDIYVSFDDDCIADPQWLRQLAEGYKQPNAAGVGGCITEPSSYTGIVSHYIHSSGNGFPPKQPTEQKKLSIMKRFTRYVRGCVLPANNGSETIVNVEELYGANGSYPIEILKTVGGWSEDFPVMEDRDLSRRIKTEFPNLQMYAVRGAKIIHDPGLSLWGYLLRPYRRGPMNLKFHQRYHILPPLFPFPVLALALASYIGILEPVHVLTVLLVAPLVLYSHWVFKFLQTRQVTNLVFPYLQMAEETMVIAGLLRGYVRNAKAKHLLIRKFLRLSLVVQLGIIGSWLAMELQGPMTVPKTVLSIAFLLVLPGYLLLRSIIGYTTKLNPSILISYSVGLSVIALMVTGLITNELLTLLGNTHPLSLRLLVAAVSLVSAVTAFVAICRKPSDLSIPPLPWQSLRSTWRYICTGIALPFIAAGGAITLNNGGSSWLASLGLGLVGIYFLTLLWRHKSGLTNVYPFALYSICLSILLGTSLRGWHITGHDIMQEYQVFELTLRHAAWHMSYYQDAYNACLSITILPTVLQRLTGMSDPFVFKFIFQLFFALIAPIMYNTLRTFASKRTALLAVFIFLTFPTFLTDITMLNRQETALMYFALAIMAGLDKRLGKRGRLLSFVFLIGMVLSHYSTSYVATGVLLITLFLYAGQRLLSIVSRRIKPMRLSIFPLPIILATLVLLVTWGSLITQTSGNISSTLSGVVTGLPAIFSSSPKSDNYSRTGKAQSSNERVQEFLTSKSSIRTLPSTDYYSNADQLTKSVTSQSDTVSAVQPILAKHNISVSTLYRVFDGVKQLYGFLIEALIGLGMLLILLVRRWRKKLNGQYRLLILASLMIIGVQVALPASLVNYGLLRIIQQGLLVLALPIVLACYWLLGLIRIPLRWKQRLIGIGLVILFGVLSGLLPALTGGYKPALALSNSGFYYEAYYTHATEIAADTWLATKVPHGSRVYSDEFSRRKLIAYAGIFSQPTLAPNTIPIDSYVYLSDGNTSRGAVPAYFNGSLIYYRVPSEFLKTDKNLLYSSGSVQIYK
jgi:uncharacterized membrane protein/glycosyltransferase involved in cell wall biosynthesis